MTDDRPIEALINNFDEVRNDSRRLREYVSRLQSSAFWPERRRSSRVPEQSTDSPGEFGFSRESETSYPRPKSSE